MKHMTTLALIGTAFLSTSGCVMDELSIGEDVYAACDPEECGAGNTGFDNGYALTEVSQLGAWSSEGFRLLGYTDSIGNPLTVHAHDSEFYIQYYSPNGGVSWEPLGVYHQEMRIVLERDNGLPAMAIHTLRVTPAPVPLMSWADPTVEIPAYYFEYLDFPTERFAPFCSRVDARGIEHMTTAVLVITDRIDLDARIVTNDATTQPWYNIACEAGSIFKNKRLGYDPELEVYMTPTHPDERTTTMKMMTADYCGDGTSYTVYGTPLLWQNDHGWFDVPAAATVEAVWGPGGAICLNTPRRPDLFFGPGNKAPCDIPTCDLGALPNGTWTTYLP